MFLMDIQETQRDGVTALMDAQNGEAPAPLLMPVLRARIVGVRGQNVNLENYEDVRGRGNVGREYTVTYRPTMNANETLIRGRWWDATPVTIDSAEVSIEERLRERLKVEIGDEMRFDVLGREVTARVTSTREVDFRDSRAGGLSHGT